MTSSFWAFARGNGKFFLAPWLVAGIDHSVLDLQMFWPHYGTAETSGKVTDRVERTTTPQPSLICSLLPTGEKFFAVVLKGIISKEIKLKMNYTSATVSMSETLMLNWFTYTLPCIWIWTW